MILEELRNSRLGEPERIRHYALRERLGGGGMGEVFLALDTRLDRLVAVKRLRPDAHLDDRGLERLRREARTAARLNHPSIVQVYDILPEKDGDWIVMEYIEGRTLRSWLAGGPLEAQRAVPLLREIAEGLAEAHKHGVVHRDLKTENVIVTPEDHAKIVDFGIAKLVAGEGEVSLTAGRGVLGTFRSMSPEQALGKEVTPRSDLFSLGILMYETLGGRSPFANDTPLGTMNRIVRDRHTPLRELEAGVPVPLCRLIDHLLQKDSELRPFSALEVAQALAALESDLGDAAATFADTRVKATRDATFDGAPALAGEVAAERALKCLLMTGLVDSTRLFESLGDQRASRVAASHDRLARDLLVEVGGREIDKTDGFLLLFERPVEAVTYALAYQDGLKELSEELAILLVARAAIHFGEVFLRRNPAEDVARGAKPVEVEGLAKSTTARLLSLAQGRQVLLTRGAFDLAREAAAGALAGRELRWQAHGSYQLQGLQEPIEIFEVGVPGFAPLSLPADSEQSLQTSATEEMILGWRPAPGQSVPGRQSWLLRKKLGEGGFGEVWLAVHDNGEKRVFKFCFSADRVRALRREVLLFRLLQDSLGHRDDIARILHWDFEKPPFSIEAEYQEQGSLWDWAQGRGGIGAVPLDTRLELVAQVADALAAAHSVGVLHKDVKPSNVLIGTTHQGLPKAVLTDFAIGLVTDRALLEARGVNPVGLTEVMATEGRVAASGTRLYTAPELMEGKPATIHADIYALGVMLYQVVAGDLSRALAPGWRRDVDDELLRHDIACFVDGSPRRRPRSASEVAERLRTLDDRRQRRQAAEQARKRARRLRRRRKTVAMVAALASVFLVVVSVLAVQALSARSAAEHRRQQAEQLIGFMLGDLREKLKPLGQLDVLNDVGDQALSYFDTLPAEELTHEDLFYRSQALHQIGEVRMEQGRSEAAMEAFEESLELAREAVRRDPDNVDRQRGLGNSHFWIGNLLRRRGDSAGALEHFEAYLATSQLLAAKEPDRPEWQLELAYAYNNVGLVLKDRGELGAALERLRSSLAIKERLVAADPENAEWQNSLAFGYNVVGSVLEASGDLKEALRQYQAQLTIMQALVEREPGHRGRQIELTTCLNLIGHRLMDLGDPSGALEQLRRATTALEALVVHDPSNANWQWRLALARSGLSRALVATGDVPGAVEQLDLAEAALRDQLGVDPGNSRWRQALATIHTRSATALEARGDPGGALVAVHQALAILEPAASAAPDDGVLHSRLATGLVIQGRIWLALDQVEKARNAWERGARGLAPFARGSRNWRFLAPYVQALLHLDRVEEARPMLGQLFEQGYRETEFLKLCRHKDVLPSARTTI